MRLIHILVLPLAFAVGFGCNKADEAPEIVIPEAPKPAEPEARAQNPDSSHWQQTFAEATRSEPVTDWRPPDVTMTGKSVGKLYTEVKNLWDTTRLTDNSGKLLSQRVILDTT